MKTTLINPIFTVVILLCIALCTSCKKEQVRQYSVELTYADGSKESYTMFDGSMLLVNHGDEQVIAKATSGSDSTLELQLTRFQSSRDSVSREFTIKKTGSSTSKLARAKRSRLDGAGNVQVTLTSMAMIDTGQRPIGACQGNCCEAKCFSTFCCGDSHECKNTPCDCKPPSNCPSPNPTPQPAQFFDLFLSGKDLVVVKG